jgi:hypothetical protein
MVSFTCHFTKESDASHACPSMRPGKVAGKGERTSEATHLFRFLILSILHGVVDMAQHVLDRIRVRQIEWKERHQWMVLYLYITSCETLLESCFI